MIFDFDVIDEIVGVEHHLREESMKQRWRESGSYFIAIKGEKEEMMRMRVNCDRVSCEVHPRGLPKLQ
jgi:hypothetical protein